MNRKQSMLILWIILPVIAVAALLWAVSLNQESRTKQAALNPQVGAGANTTGGVNAVGEVLAGNKANAGIKNDVAASNAQPEAQKPAKQAAAPGSPNLVEPQSLDQGFIIIVKDKTGKASPSSPIYLAGSINGWNPKSEDWKLSPQSDMRWRIAVPRQNGGMEFKFTRGSWELEELNAEMKPPANRTLAKIDASKLAPGEQPKIELEIDHWGDEQASFTAKKGNDPYRSITVAAGTLKRVQVRGGGGSASSLTRDLLVWLPPGYDDAKNANRHYPVLYMHDGQNLFEKSGVAPASWDADKTAGALIGKGETKPFIIVGVPHGGAARMEEYVPPMTLADGKKELFPGRAMAGNEHVQWLINEVMPRVERTFRIASGPENTAIGGASLGGLISLYAGATHPEIFGLVLAESPSLVFKDMNANQALFAPVRNWPRRVYVAMGDQEGGADPKDADGSSRLVSATRDLGKMLEQQGLGPDRRQVVIDPGAKHDEMAWGKRLPGALRFIFPSELDSTK
jgi:pullulanase